MTGTGRAAIAITALLVSASPDRAPPSVLVEDSVIVPTDDTALYHFGNAISVSDDGLRVLIGARDDDGAGSARIFVRSDEGWVQEALLTAPDRVPRSRFGCSVALDADGSTALVGAIGDPDMGWAGSSATVFRRSGVVWTLEASLPPGSEPAFGDSVDLSNDGGLAVVGAPAWPYGSGVGSAHVFRREGSDWIEEHVFLGRGPGDHASAVLAVAPDGSRVVVGGASSWVAPRVYARAGTDWIEDLPVPIRAPMNVQAAAFDALGDRLVLGGVLGTVVYSRSGTTWTASSTSDARTPGIHGRHVDIGVFGLRVWTTLLAPSPTGWTPVTELAGSGAPYSYTAAAIDAGGRVAFAGAEQALSSRGITGLVDVFDLEAAALGHACTSAEHCLTGQCVDGVCCETSCGGGAVDCLGCAEAMTGRPNGTCAVRSLGSICRGSGGTCDVEEACDGSSPECPPDAYVVGGVICRPSTGECDPSEACTGDHGDCPLNALRSPSTICRATSDATCDPVESCDGTTSTCPPDVNACVTPDAGPDASADSPDGGPPVTTPTCGCHTVTAGGPSGSLLAVFVAAVFRPRRRHASRRSVVA